MDLKLLALLPLLLLTACLDATGFQGNCRIEKQQVFNREGQPDDTNGPNEVGGNFTESWIYDHGFYVFRWGTSFPTCDVDGPIQADLVPG